MNRVISAGIKINCFVIVAFKEKNYETDREGRDTFTISQ